MRLSFKEQQSHDFGDSVSFLALRPMKVHSSQEKVFRMRFLIPTAFMMCVCKFHASQSSSTRVAQHVFFLSPKDFHMHFQQVPSLKSFGQNTHRFRGCGVSAPYVE